MNTRYRYLTSDSVRLTAKIKNGTAYLFLTLNYGYVEHRLVRGKPKRIYIPLVVSTGFSVAPKYWLDGDFTPEARRVMKRDCQKMTAAIETQRQQIFATYNAVLKELNVKPSPQQMLRRLSTEASLQVRIKLADYARDFARSPDCRSSATRKKYETISELIDHLEVIRTLPAFQRFAQGRGPVYLNSFNLSDWNDYVAMIANARTSIPLAVKKYGAAGVEFVQPGESGYYALSTAARYQKCVLSLLNRARRKIQGLRFEVDLDILERTVATDQIQEYLTSDELALLISHRFDQSGIENVRKLFVLECFTGVRYSDLNTLLSRTPETLQPNPRMPSFQAIRFLAIKGKVQIILPLFAPALEILASPPRLITNQKYNDALKVMGRELGLDRQQHVITRKADGSVTDRLAPLWTTLSSHSARRTLKTLLEAAPLFCSRTLVASMMGHTLRDRSADLGYFSLTPDQRAQALIHQCRPNASELPFTLIAEEK
jgi:hypothetical protein